MTFKVKSVQAFMDELKAVCLENCGSIPSNIAQKSSGNYNIVKLDDAFIARLNKLNPLAMDQLYKLS
jgi:hypothetical protein